MANNKDCIRVVFEGDNAPYFANGRAYIRVADESKQLSPSELEKFFKGKRQASPWDSSPSDETLNDINTNKLRPYMKKANETGRLNYKFSTRNETLKKLGLAVVFFRKPVDENDIGKNSDPDQMDITPQVTPEVLRLINTVEGEMTRIEIQEKLELNDEKHFREIYQQAGIRLDVIEMTIPDEPTSRLQKYRLTKKGMSVKLKIKKI
jgi:ATP-dependent DNA helicase RecG